MRYLIVQDWKSTRGNHAGMEHMCDMLVERWPDLYIKICKKNPRPLPQRSIGIIGRILRRYDRYKFKKEWVADYMSICQPMFKKLKIGDEVFLLEYNWPATSQLEIAKYIKSNFTDVKIRSLSHITPTLFARQHAEKYIAEWAKYVDTEMTMGSGLSKYLIDCGVPESKISTGFHYVDNTYYKKTADQIYTKDRLTIIAIGALQRDFQLLSEIVNNTPWVDWIICKGRKNVENLFKGNNVRLIGYVPEDELRQLMAEADASLNVLEDTVGSNVITTSLAMGLAIIVSDVGSIRDHVDERCAIFCKNNANAFIDAIKFFSKNPDRIVEMRKNALMKVNNITSSKVNDWFSSLDNLKK